MKIWPFDAIALRGTGRHISADELREGLEPFRRIREAVGDRMEIMLEGHGYWDITTAKKIAHAIEEYRPAWLEDLVLGHDVDQLAELKASTSTPILASEFLITRYQYRPLMEKRAADIIMVDPTWTGGITESRKIITMAESFGLPVALHDCTGPFTLLAGVHLAFSAPNAIYQEHVRAYIRTWYRELVADTRSTVADGHILPPDRAGHRRRAAARGARAARRDRPDLATRPTIDRRRARDGRDRHRPTIAVRAPLGAGAAGPAGRRHGVGADPSLARARVPRAARRRRPGLGRRRPRVHRPQHVVRGVAAGPRPSGGRRRRSSARPSSGSCAATRPSSRPGSPSGSTEVIPSAELVRFAGSGHRDDLARPADRARRDRPDDGRQVRRPFPRLQRLARASASGRGLERAGPADAPRRRARERRHAGVDDASSRSCCPGTTRRRSRPTFDRHGPEIAAVVMEPVNHRLGHDPAAARATSRRRAS